MKAHIRDKHEHKGRFNGHKYKLTVSMIVKNEEEKIRRCLDSLKPLLEAVPSELIITDTGSTDNTVEIIKEYTDKVLYFEFNGDMAAARNVGLRAAQGEWFMSIDADEWFDDVSEIIRFFNSNECDKFACASYNIRNYYDFDGKEYANQVSSRIARIYDGLHYEGHMHETLAGRQNPYKQINSFVHHYGYVFKNEEERLTKFNRNVAGLKQEIEQHPEQIRFIYQIVKEYAAIEDTKTAVEWCKKGLEVEKQYPDPIHRIQIKTQLMSLYFHMGEYLSVINVGNDFFAAEMKQEIFHLDACELQMYSYMKMEDYEKAIKVGMLYLDIYQKYSEGLFDNSVLLLGISDGATPWAYAQACHNLTKCYIQMADYENAAIYFDKINMSDIDSAAYATVLLGIVIADKTECYERIIDLYGKIEQTDSDEKRSNFIEIAESYFRENPKVFPLFMKALAQAKYTTPYIQLNKLRLANENGLQDDAGNLINWFIRNFTDWSAYYSDVLYAALKWNLDIKPFFNFIDIEELRLYITQIVNDHTDYAAVISDYFLKHSFDTNLKGLYWSICLCERVALSSGGMNPEQYVACFKNYALNVAAYAHRVYQPELFTEDSISILPRAYRFGHYMQLAFAAKDNGNEVEYIKNLKLALHHYPVMKNAIEVLSEYFEAQQKAQEQQIKHQNDEFADLANVVKAQIEQFLLRGQNEEAGAVLAQLAELLPNDEDVKRYRLQIHTAQTSKGIGTKIPQ